jgi:hypothetical protein
MASEKYQAYLCSREWGLKREAVHKRAEGKCERCQWRDGKAVHHQTYARIYNERLTDLILLCDVCHAYQHGREHEIDAEQVHEEAREWMKMINSGKDAILAKGTSKHIVCDGKHTYVNIVVKGEFWALADCHNLSWRAAKAKRHVSR